MTDSLAAGSRTGLEIAIVGMAGRFPGAHNLDAFWRNLRDGVESITFFSDEELKASGVDTASLRDPSYVKAGAILDEIESFDAPFFGINPREAEVMDPQHRVFLECAWEALEHAGYNPELYPGSIGVYAGVSMSTYFFNLHADYDPLALASSPQILLGNGKDYMATRVSYKMNLDGPSVSVQTACSTALVAVHLAARGLLSGECDMALAGAASINVPQKLGYRYQEEGVHSPDGHCRAFDARAQGTVFGNGVGIVVLKRLDDALADGDTIHAIITGTAINNDGALKVGYTAPSVEGQFKAITAAQRLAEVDPATISYVETHGTGTLLGDPIEIAALTQAFRTGTDRTGFCAIGSVKTNIGHTNVAAGAAGLIKTVLALQHKQIPPSLHFQSPNPNIDFANSPFYVNASLAEWRSGGAPRRAGVSSFGLGGTNAHAIVEEAPPLPASGPSRPWQLLLLSARTAGALEAATANLAAQLERQPDLDLADIAYTLQIGRKPFEHRRMLVCRDRADALAALADSQRVVTAMREPAERPVVFMFPGGGTQYVDMGRELYATEPLFRETIDRCAELLRPRLGYDIRDLLYPPTNDERRTTNDEGSSTNDERRTTNDEGSDSSFVIRRSSDPGSGLERTGVALPALFMVEYALAQLWMSWGVQPQAMIGHSLGEYVAACLAGVFSLEDALALVLVRGQLIEQLPAGAMISVALSEAELQPLLNDQLDLAAVNGPALCAVSGPLAAIDALAATLRERSIGFRRIKIAAAGHSELIAPILEPFTQFVAKLRLRPPTIPYISNVSGTWITAAEATDPHYWARHLRRTVRFAAGIAELLDEPERILLEVGPGRTLASLARMQPRADALNAALSSMRHQRDERPDVAVLLEALGQLWLAGVRVDWPAFSAGEQRRRLPLPTYPFERQRYWIDPPAQDRATQRDRMRRKADVADWFYIPSWKLSLPPAPLKPDEIAELGARWLIFLDDGAVGRAMAGRLEQAGQEVIAVLLGARFERLDDRIYTLDPRDAEGYAALTRELRDRDRLPTIVVHCWSLAPQPPELAGKARFERIQERGYYSLLFLCHALEAAQITAPLRIVALASRLCGVTEDEPVEPEQATLLGPCNVIPQEYPNITCHCIDIAGPETASGLRAERLIDQLLADIAADAPDRQIAYRGAQRWVRAFEEVRLDERARPTRAIRERGVYLITGGLGNVGLLLAKQLARGAQARLALLGRSGLPPRDAWAAWFEAHDPREDVSHKIRSVQALEALGAEVLVIAADVVDAGQMRAAIAQIEARFGELNGVIHAAGITSGDSIFQPIKAIGRAESEAQFRPKVYGLYALEQALHGQALDFCILISSNAAILGGLGLIAYAAANLFMDAFSAQRSKGSDLTWISTNWDGWPPREDDRLVTAVSTSLDQYAMAPGEAIDAFERIVARATVAQVAVSAGDLPARIDFWVRRVAAARTSAEPAQEAPELHPRPELQSSYIAPRNEIERMLAEIWQALLGIDEVGVEDNFFRLGGHSLLATQLMSRVRDTFQVALPVRSLFEAPTVAALAERIAQAQGALPDGDGPRPRPRGAEQRALPASFAQQRLWFLDQLEPGNPFYNDAAAVRLSGALELDALRRSLGAVVRRHETLRTTFATHDGEPVQVIAPASASTRAAPLRLIDLRALPEARREPALLRLAGAERLRAFDLGRGPLLRVTLLRLNNREHVLLLTTHHIVADAWSMGILIRELAALYDAYATGRSDRLPALPIQYADFAIWQRERLSGEGDPARSPLQTQLAYWRDRLAGAPPLLALPTDRPRPPVQSFAGATYLLTLPRELADSLAELSRREGVTLFMTLLATFKLLLAQVSGQEDIVVGTNVANRNRSETEGLIGFFVNMLVLRTDLSGDPTFRELLGRVRETALSAYAHQDLPFEQLVAALRPERSRSHAPLFQVVFTLQNAPLAIPQMPGLAVTPLKITSRAAKYDIVFNIAETEQGLAGTLEYDTQLFDAATIARLADQFETLLRAVVARAEDRLSALAELLPELDRQQQLVRAKDFQAARLQKFKQVKRRVIDETPDLKRET